MGADLLQMRRPAGKVHRHARGRLRDLRDGLLRRAEKQVALLPLELLNLLLEADLLRSTSKDSARSGRLDRERRWARTCWAICGLISLPVRR